MLKSEDFYDYLSADYDGMINYDEALKKRQRALVPFISRLAGRAADLGCGTGIDSIALALNGFQVEGFDNSSGMLKKAKINAKRYGVKINFHKFSLDAIPESYYGRYAFITSLGNTLANLNPGNLNKVFNIISKLLTKGGRVLIQILNYDRILKEKERIVSITEYEDSIFVRFYDFPDNNVNFNILQFDRTNYRNKKLITTRLYPYCSDYIFSKLKESGISKLELFGDLEKSSYNQFTSKDIVIMGEKNR